VKFGKEVVEYYMMESRPGGVTGWICIKEENMRKIIIVSVALILLLVASACDMEVYDDDEKILRHGNSHSASHISQTKTGTTVGGRVKEMTGMATLWRYDVPWEESVEVAYGISVEKGRVKMVFISPNDEITVLTELTEPGQDVGEKELTLKKGESRIKIVASDRAKFDFLLEVHKGEIEGIGD
jgi:hypothetical protein